MAIATLAECYHNPKVFTGVVKIRKGLAVRLLQDCGGDDMRKYRCAPRPADSRTPAPPGRSPATHALPRRGAGWFAHFAGKMRATALALPDGAGSVCAERCAKIIELANKAA